jgi:hypothetical protein
LVVLPEVRPGNLRALDRNFSPTGEKQSTTCRLAFLLVPAEQVGHQAGGQHVVDVLEEALLLNTVLPGSFQDFSARAV